MDFARLLPLVGGVTARRGGHWLPGRRLAVLDIVGCAGRRHRRSGALLVLFGSPPRTELPVEWVAAGGRIMLVGASARGRARGVSLS